MKCLLFAKVRRLFHRDCLSISEIRRRTSLSRNTIKAWLKETRADVHQYPKGPKVDGKLTPFVPRPLLALDADSRRPKRDRRTALMPFETIKKEDLPRIGRHPDEGHQRAAGAADLELPKMAPIDLGLLVGQGAQTQEGLGRGRCRATRWRK